MATTHHEERCTHATDREHRIGGWCRDVPHHAARRDRSVPDDGGQQLRSVDVPVEYRWADGRPGRASAVHLPVRDRRPPPSPQRPSRADHRAPRRRTQRDHRVGAVHDEWPEHETQSAQERARQLGDLRRTAPRTRTHHPLPLGAVRSIRLGSHRHADSPRRQRSRFGRGGRRAARCDALGHRRGVPAVDEQSRECVPSQRDPRERYRHLHPRILDRRPARTSRGLASDHRLEHRPACGPPQRRPRRRQNLP